MKPVLQAFVLADHVYTDGSGKKIIAGTFNRIIQKPVKLPEPPLTPDPTTGKERKHIMGGTDMGCPWFYLSLTDVVDGTQIILQFVDRGKNEVLFETSIKIQNNDRLATIEIAQPLPPLGRMLREPGEYSFDVVSEGEILGAHRLIVEMSS